MLNATTISIAIAVKSLLVMQETRITVTATTEQWAMAWQVIDRSRAAHDSVKAVQEFLYPQLVKQIDTTHGK